MNKTIVGVILMVMMMMSTACGGKKAIKQPGPVEGGNKVITAKAAGSNVYFIKTDRGYLMVDSGLFGGPEKIKKLFDGAGINPKEVQLIILTHGHSDHLGGLAAAKQFTGAGVLAHKQIVPYLENAEGEPVVPTNLKGKILHAITPPLKLEKTVPEIIMEDEYDLSEFGIAGKIIHTPGHSPGSLSIILDNGETLVGDQVRGKGKKLSLGMFYENKMQLIASLEKVAAYNPAIIYMSHGTFTDNKTLVDYLAREK